MRTHCIALICSAPVPLLAGLASGQTPIGTTFTYQGQLEASGAAVDNAVDFEFKLFDSTSGGAQVGSTNPVNNVTVAKGLFTVSLDFGSSPFSGDERWLEIAVRSPAGSGAFTTLSPRQPLTAAPFALYALSGPGSGGPWAVTGNSIYTTNTGNVGIGTAVPAAKLHVKGADEGLRLDGPGAGAANVSYISFRDANGTRSGYVGDGSGSDNSVYLNSDAGDIHLYTAVGAALSAKSDGKVGIGTTLPATRLHVNGQSAWITGGNGGALASSAGAGLRLYDDGVRSNIFAFNYASGTARDLALQQPGGNVGIGTTTPGAKLDVRGNIKLGSSGQYSALGGVEDLRLVRGDVDGDGTVIRGAGFTVNRVQEGVYDVSFTPPFSGVPTVTAQAVIGTGQPRWATSAPVFLSASTARIIMETGGGFTDSDWSLCVIGPR